MNNNNHCGIGILFLWCLVSCSLLNAACAQRAIANLGKRVLSNGSSSSSRDTLKDEFIIRNEQQQQTSAMQLDEIDLSFEGIKLALNTKSAKKKDKSPTRLILDGSCHGHARAGRMLAIMGPSGSGKSSLLHSLAGRVKESSSLSLEGNRYLNGHSLRGDSMLPCAFIQQEAVFFPHMTVRETLNFRVELQLGRLASKAARDEMVDDLMAQVGLTTVADSIVGDAKVRGISGGERKRLSIAVEMISSPSLIFLDEPTSGLDSTAAISFCETLRKLADQGKTVIAVIHQPSQHVFSLFDDLLLLSEGRQMYFGEIKSVRAYMEKNGYPAGKEIGTAEHVLDCISRQPILGETEEEASIRVDKLAAVAEAARIDLVGDGSGDDDDKVEIAMLRQKSRPGSGLLNQFRLLLKRSLGEIIRGKTATAVVLFQQVTVAVIYGLIYGMGTNQASIQDRFGLMSLIAIGGSNMAVSSAVLKFPKEKAIVSNELGARMYNALPYFIAKAFSTFPLMAFYNSVFGVIVYKLTGLSKMPGKLARFLAILISHGLSSEASGLLVGAISPNADVALAIFPAVLVLNIIFDGKNISEENTPRFLRWIPNRIGLIRWGFEGLCLNEFEGLTFDTSGPRRGPVAHTGEEALARFGLGGKTIGDVIRVQGTVTLASWFLSYLGLSLTRQRFMVMKPATPSPSS